MEMIWSAMWKGGRWGLTERPGGYRKRPGGSTEIRQD